jgi:hypothetical protein
LKRTQPKTPPDDARAIREEIPKLLKMKMERASRVAQIQEQNVGSMFSKIFPNHLMFSAASHPATFEVLRVGVQVGRAVVMVWKDEIKRARPAQLSAAIDPVIETPGHPSYPSGHSTQAHLVARLLAAVHPRSKDSAWRKAIEGLASEVARNREVAGVHYLSDSEAGVDLARALAGILLDDKMCPSFGELVKSARREWT